VENYLTDYYVNVIENSNETVNKFVSAFMQIEPTDLLWHADCYYNRMFTFVQLIINFYTDYHHKICAEPLYNSLDEVLQALIILNPDKWQLSSSEESTNNLIDFSYNKCPLYIYDRFCYDRLFYQASK
jgi:hypothetical protein